jgi:hypothetical protein
MTGHADAVAHAHSSEQAPLPSHPAVGAAAALVVGTVLQRERPLGPAAQTDDPKKSAPRAEEENSSVCQDTTPPPPPHLCRVQRHPSSALEPKVHERLPARVHRRRESGEVWYGGAIKGLHGHHPQLVAVVDLVAAFRETVSGGFGGFGGFLGGWV